MKKKIYFFLNYPKNISYQISEEKKSMEIVEVMHGLIPENHQTDHSFHSIKKNLNQNFHQLMEEEEKKLERVPQTNKINELKSKIFVQHRHEILKGIFDEENEENNKLLLNLYNDFKEKHFTISNEMKKDLEIVREKYQLEIEKKKKTKFDDSEFDNWE